MYYCLICERKYPNDESYNDHLSRKQHRTKLMKLQTIYGTKDPDSIEYQQWVEKREKYNSKKPKRKDQVE